MVHPLVKEAGCPYLLQHNFFFQYHSDIEILNRYSQNSILKSYCPPCIDYLFKTVSLFKDNLIPFKEVLLLYIRGDCTK